MTIDKLHVTPERHDKKKSCSSETEISLNRRRKEKENKQLVLADNFKIRSLRSGLFISQRNSNRKWKWVKKKLLNTMSFLSVSFYTVLLHCLLVVQWKKCVFVWKFYFVSLQVVTIPMACCAGSGAKLEVPFRIKARYERTQ